MENQSSEVYNNLEIIRKRLGLVLLIPVALFLLVWLWWGLKPDIYQATVVIDLKIPEVKVDLSRYGMVFPRITLEHYKVITEKQTLLKNIIGRLGLKDAQSGQPMSTEELKGMLTTEFPKVNLYKPEYVSTAALVRLNVSGKSPALIRDIANIWAQNVIEEGRVLWDEKQNAFLKLFEKEEQQKYSNEKFLEKLNVLVKLFEKEEQQKYSNKKFLNEDIEIFRTMRRGQERRQVFLTNSLFAKEERLPALLTYLELSRLHLGYFSQFQDPKSGRITSPNHSGGFRRPPTKKALKDSDKAPELVNSEANLEFIQRKILNAQVNIKALEKEILLLRERVAKQKKALAIVEDGLNKTQKSFENLEGYAANFKQFKADVKLVHTLKSNNIPDLRILTPALKSETPIGPDRMKYAVLSGLLGLMFSMGLSMFLELGARK